MGKRVTKLPLELEAQLQEIADVLERRRWRKELKNTLGCIALYEGWIEQAKQPFIHNEEDAEWMRKSSREFHEGKVKR